MVIKNIDKLITKKYLRMGYNVHPEAVKLLRNIEASLLDEVITLSCTFADGSIIVTDEDVRKAILRVRKNGRSGEVKGRKEKKRVTEGVVSEVDGNGSRIRILKDVTGNSSCEGKVEDFVVYFNSRFEKLSKILSSRLQPTPIAHLGKARNSTVSVVGIISDIRSGKNAHVIELEDKTGRVRCIATGKLREIAEELMGDEVIGVTGTLRDRAIIADRIVFPDIPVNGNKKVRKDFSIVFISDTHFGSREFLSREWEMFVKWLNGEIGDERSKRLAESVRYVILAGDVVDGVGIYPGQENDLVITDVYKQYEMAAENLDGFPDDVTVIMAPGNHDAVRQAEPQPQLPKEIRDLFPKNVVHVGNPSLISLDGVKVLVYHGRSIDDMVAKIPRLSYKEPHKVMEEMLKRRHLSPMYGGRSPLAPEKDDYLVIDDVPDILHCGHVHTFGVGFYRGVFLVNSSTWQEQTEFQRKVNLNPMPCHVAVYTPGGEVVRLKFRGG